MRLTLDFQCGWISSYAEAVRISTLKTEHFLIPRRIYCHKETLNAISSPFEPPTISICALLSLVFALVASSALAADFSGAWTGQIVFQSSPQQHAIGFNLKADGSKLTGTFCLNNCGPNAGNWDIQDAKMDGNKVSFSVALGAPDLPRLDVQGTLNGDTMNLVISGNPPECGDAGCQIGTGTASRKN